MRLSGVLIVAASLAACATVKNPVVMSNVSADLADYVVNNMQPDAYPSFMAAEGNIYSCRYGIHHQSSDEFSPPKAVIFGSILRQELPHIAEHKVVLDRFDVYNNRRLKVLRAAGSGMGGIVGSGIAKVSRVNSDVFTFEKLKVDRNPGSFVIPEENMVGCDKAREGEYYASQITGGHDVVVTWLEFQVDSVDFKLRTFYQFQPATPGEVNAGIDEAIRMSIRAAATLVDDKLQ